MSWEYTVVELSKAVDTQEAQLNIAGEGGWQLVCVSDGRAYLSRQVFDEETTIRFVEKHDTEEGVELVGHAAACCSTGCGC